MSRCQGDASTEEELIPESIEIDVRLETDAEPARLEELAEHVLKVSIIPDTIARPVPVSMRLT